MLGGTGRLDSSDPEMLAAIPGRLASVYIVPEPLFSWDEGGVGGLKDGGPPGGDSSGSS